MAYSKWTVKTEAASKNPSASVLTIVSYGFSMLQDLTGTNHPPLVLSAWTSDCSEMSFKVFLPAHSNPCLRTPVPVQESEKSFLVRKLLEIINHVFSYPFCPYLSQPHRAYSSLLTGQAEALPGSSEMWSDFSKGPSGNLPGKLRLPCQLICLLPHTRRLLQTTFLSES